MIVCLQSKLLQAQVITANSEMEERLVTGALHFSSIAIAAFGYLFYH